MNQEELQKRILAAFQTESEEQLSVLRFLIENWPDSISTQLDEAFRMAHSMKGGARVCGLSQLEIDVDISFRPNHDVKFCQRFIADVRSANVVGARGYV